MVAVVRKAKIPKMGPQIIFKRSYKLFKKECFKEEVKNQSWEEILKECNPNKALYKFEEILMPIVNRHAPLRKFTVRNTRTPWLDHETREHMKLRDQAKKTAILTGYELDWVIYRKLRNYVTKLNRMKKKLYYENRITGSKNDNKKVWKTLNELMGENSQQTPSFLEVDGSFFTRPSYIANYLSKYFVNKVDKLSNNMPSIDTDNISNLLIKDNIMKNK